MSCSTYLADIRYNDNSLDDYYFPLFSAEYIKREQDCIEKKQFPCNVNQPQDSIDEFQNQWFSKHLKSLKEPILYNLKDDQKNVIRFTHLGTWSKPFSYSIEKIENEIILIYNKTNGLGGYRVGHRIKHRKKRLSQNSWNQIIEKIDRINYWDIETHDLNLINDGEMWILEVLIEGKYHFVYRNRPGVTTDMEFAELCKLIWM